MPVNPPSSASTPAPRIDYERALRRLCKMVDGITDEMQHPSEFCSGCEAKCDDCDCSCTAHLFNWAIGKYDVPTVAEPDAADHEPFACPGDVLCPRCEEIAKYHEGA